ncbi:hypothetical protein [Streptomyces sp. NPDC057686]|uniref:hypothetical protein n=1 Tax=Streptomyces sp. NPDC057686 TaxID=3346212 RepID=UPI0036806C9A
MFMRADSTAVVAGSSVAVKATRNRGHFPSEQVALKVLYLAVREQIKPKARAANHVAAH